MIDAGHRYGKDQGGAYSWRPCGPAGSHRGEATLSHNAVSSACIMSITAAQSPRLKSGCLGRDVDQMNTPRSIQQELERVAALDSNALVADSDHKDDREWWVLGRAAACLSAAGETFPRLAQKLPPPGPDFKVWWERRTPAFHLEVTEALTPNRRRTEEYRRWRANPPAAGFGVIGEASLSREEAWGVLAVGIKSKLAKAYPKETVLLIYHNMWSLDFKGPWQWPEDLIAAAGESDLLAEALGQARESSIARILVLSSGGDGLVSLFPSVQTVWNAPRWAP